MSKGRVLVIDDDEWVCRLLSVAMREAGFEISISESAADGFFRAVEEQPDCIVCDVDLPDHNGYWVARRIRSHPSRVSSIPFVFLSGLDDREHRLEGFQVGGDAYLTKPFRIDEVVAQVDAFIQMAARLRKQRQSLASIPPAGAALTGDLAQMSVATLLTLLDLERRSGRLELKKGDHRAVLVVVSGNVISTTLDEAPSSPLQTLRTTMNWDSGKFSFVPTTESAGAETELTPINALLMEAARLEDEERKDDEDAPSNRIASVLARAPAISTLPPSSLNLEYVVASAQPNAPSEPAPAVPELPPAPAAPPPPAIDLAAQLLAGEGLPEEDATRPVEVPVRPTQGDKRPPPPPPLKSPGFSSKATLPGAPKLMTSKPLPPPVGRSMTPRNATPATSSAANAPGTPKPGPVLPPGNPLKDSRPGVPGTRTAFGAALRSLSPSKPMRAVPAPAPSQTNAAPKPALEKPTAKEPEIPPPSESVDAGWSVPPEGNDDETKKPGAVE